MLPNLGSSSDSHWTPDPGAEVRTNVFGELTVRSVRTSTAIGCSDRFRHFQRFQRLLTLVRRRGRSTTTACALTQILKLVR